MLSSNRIIAIKCFSRRYQNYSHPAISIDEMTGDSEKLRMNFGATGRENYSVWLITRLVTFDIPRIKTILVNCGMSSSDRASKSLQLHIVVNKVLKRSTWISQVADTPSFQKTLESLQD